MGDYNEPYFSDRNGARRGMLELTAFDDRIPFLCVTSPRVSEDTLDKMDRIVECVNAFAIKQPDGSYFSVKDVAGFMRDVKCAMNAPAKPICDGHGEHPIGEKCGTCLFCLLCKIKQHLSPEIKNEKDTKNLMNEG